MQKIIFYRKEPLMICIKNCLSITLLCSIVGGSLLGMELRKSKVTKGTLFLRMTTPQYFPWMIKPHYEALLGRKLGDDEVFLDVGAYDENNSPWCMNKRVLDGKFPLYLPVSIFEGAEEGKVVSFQVNGKEIEVVCKQSPAGYNGRPFETVLNSLLNYAENNR